MERGGSTIRKREALVRVRTGVLFAVAAVLVSGCDSKAEVVKIAEVVEFAEMVSTGVADTRTVPTAIPLDATSSAYLPSGWNHPRRTDGAGVASFWMRSTRGPAAVVEIPIASPGPLTLKLKSRSLTVANAPLQAVTFLWNDKVLARRTVQEEGSDVQLVIPVESQLRGLNTLALLPHFWVGRAGDFANVRDVKAGVEVLSLELSTPNGRPPSSPARATDPNTVVQPSGTVTSLYSLVPNHAVVHGAIGLPSESHGDGVSAALVLRRDGEAETILGEWASSSLNSGKPTPFRFDLAPYSGQAVSLSFIVSESQASGAAVEWRGVKIEGERAVVEATPAPKPDKPVNVVVILFDTLRADAIGVYGRPNARTPNMDRFAGTGVLFENATSNSSSTRPSVATLLTGLSPAVHNVNILDTGLPEQVPYLPAILQGAGYTTIGVSDNPNISKNWGFSRGFGHFSEVFGDDDYQKLRTQGRAEELAEHTWAKFVAPFLAQSGAKAAPFFLYLHAIDPHFPYDVGPPDRMPEDFGYRGALLADPDSVVGGEDVPLLVRYSQTTSLRNLLNRGRTVVGPADLRYLRSRYQAEVAYMDGFLGPILTRLNEVAPDRDSLVIFLSDHGEEFLEHGRWTHGPAAYQESVHVPLVMSYPPLLPAGRRSPVVAQLLDVTPTVLDIAGLERPVGMQGRSLVRYASAGREHGDPESASVLADRVFLAKREGELVQRRHRQRAIRIRDWKLVAAERRDSSDPVRRYELFDLSADPAETVNLWAARPILGNALRQAMSMEAVLDSRVVFEAPLPEVDEDTKNRLRALGYLQ